VILADPPWEYEFSETDNRKVENQYPTLGLDAIKSLPESDPTFPPLAGNAVLFLWATAPKLKEGLQVMEAWGFAYLTNAVWDKEVMGMGYWFRGQHEHLLVGTRGGFQAPAASLRQPSVFRERRGRHSAKPECVYAALEAMFPGAARVELFQRTPRSGWAGWGDQLPADGVRASLKGDNAA
jgi:N6-adenosine-specific RNA methylase IME4